jgi:Tfp pilus assembly protein PilN
MKGRNAQSVWGVVQDLDGRYVATRLEKVGGRWQKVSTIRFDARAVHHHAVTLRKGVRFGITARWRPAGASTRPPEMVDAEGDTAMHVPCAAKAELDTHVASLAHNLLGVMPEDAYLASLPLAFIPDAADSFVTVELDESFWTIGIIIKRRLVGRFRLAPATPDALAGHLARVERYWARTRSEAAFPAVIYSLSERGTVPAEALESTPVFAPLPEQLTADRGATRAAGVALAGTDGMVPRFTGPTPASAFRAVRTGLYVTAAVLALLGPVAALLPRGLDAWYEHRKRVSQDEYREVMAGNRQIRELMTETNRLAHAVLRLENTFSRQTSWGRFLDALGHQRPTGLYLAKMGTRPLGKRTDIIQVALAGSSTTTAAVTTFIAKLQDMPFVSGVKLNSMERDKKRRSLTNFRIVCTLTLSSD